MEYHIDYSLRGSEQESTGLKQHHNSNDKGAENLMGNHNRALIKENANNEWSLNGMRNHRMYDYQYDETDPQQAPQTDCIAGNHAGSHDNVSCAGDYVKSEKNSTEKFNDILISNRQNMDGSHLNKNKSNNYDSKFSRMHNFPLLSEDLRISKIIRRLMVENNRNAAIDLCKKLETAVHNQSNATYICRSFDILFDNMLSVLRQCPVECLENASSILGVMGYINRYNFAIYKGHLIKAYENYKNVRKYLMMSLKTTLRCDAVNLDLKTYSERLLILLKEYLENAEMSENFISISETIAEFSKNYKTSFQRHFTDIVDIIVGWHLEVEQPTKLKRHCAKVLQQFAEYFLNELDFTFGLLGQFIEDIDACREDILAEDSTSTSIQQSEIRVGSFIGAFTSIVKALSSKGINLKEFGTASVILTNAKEAIKNTAKICFERITLLSEETVVNLNEFYCLILLYDKSVENLNDFEGLIKQQINHLTAFNDNQQASFLFMILNIVRQYRTQLPLSFVTLIMDTESISLKDLKLNCGLKAFKLLMKIYHEILIIKNVPLLQEAYRHILKDITDTLECLSTVEGNPDSMMRSEMLFNFYLSALTALACQTSSIIGMYALKPSILELLIKNCQGSKHSLWTKYPTLHTALLELIIDHCMKNHNFRQSSRLLKQHQDSPSSENFAMILKFLAELLQWYVSKEIFVWLENILQECREDCDILCQTEHFLAVCDNITILATKHPLICSTIIEKLLKYPKIPKPIVSNIRDIALCLNEGTDKKLAAEYCKILAQLPLDICLTPNCDKQLYNKNRERILVLYQWHKSSPCFNGLRPKYFKIFLESLDPNLSTTNTIHASLVEKSSCNLQRDHFLEYIKTIQDNEQLLSYHLQYEAARYCIQQKLRTTLGKPQETFLAIEAVIMKYARFLAEKEGLPLTYKNIKDVVDIQENCRMLLGFLECLEKHVYNAAEGTAYAMAPAEKPAKTFFRVNSSTCREWFKRIRTAVNLISLHSMEPELVIRYSESILETEATHTNLALLDRTVTSLVWALYNCGESDTLYGLINWLKPKHGKRFEWIQYVAEQASGHLEKAATGYLYTLHDENNKTMDSYIKEFLQKQLTDCFYHTARWSEIPNISQETIYSKQHLQIMEQAYQSDIYLPSSWKNQELTNSLLELTEWPEQLLSTEKVKYSPKLETYSYYETLRKLQDSCIMKANASVLKDGVNESMEKCFHQSIRNALLRGYEPGFNNNQLNELVILNHIFKKQYENEDIVISTEDNCLDTKMSSILLSKALYMSLITGKQNKKQQEELLLNLSSKARIENNLNYCQSLLTKFFKSQKINLPLNEIAQQLKTNQMIINYHDDIIVQGIEELVKCLQAQTTSITDALELGSACCSEVLKLQQNTEKTKNSCYPQSISNLLLTMADWLTIHRLNNANLTNGQQFQKLQLQLPEITCCSISGNSKSNVLSSSDYAVGKLLNASILCRPDSGEAWFSYGNWCYRWGKKLMETKGTEQSTTSINDFKDVKLTKRNVSSIQDLLKNKFDNDSIQQIIDLLNNHILNAINDDNAEDLDTNSCTENTTEILERELKNVCSLNMEQLNEILSIWRQAHKGVYSCYEEATRAYFKYLAIESELSGKKYSAQGADNNEVEDCTFVTTTLRLLRLIVKHAIGLQDVLEEGLRNTPLRPWKVIVPQLFSRLNHHEPYVRKSLAELLCRLAVNQPQLIIFPAVVGAHQELKHRNNANTQIQLTNCFSSLLNSLAEQAPETVLQVQLLVKELRRITLLWDEHWLHGLSQLYAEYSPLYNSLDAEAKKTNNIALMEAKYEVFRQHLLADFKQIAIATDKEPETNYEHNFQERFGSYIEAVLKELEKVGGDSKPTEYWYKIKQLYGIFQQKPLRGNSSTLKISEISPVLANMHNTTIAMPGVDTYEQPAVYIKSVEATAFIFISTKTKPKKLSFYGCNGQRYTYLFKGQEDLHLDERIMQFLSISNSMMARSYGSKAKTDCFKADHYSVIPLGSRSGLIRWVDNCFPLFAIYKKWQQRDALQKQQQKERQSSAKGQESVEQSPVGTTNATRPSDLFYKKLTPLLAEYNIKVTDPRRQWPVSVLKRVLKELSTETPKDLLSKEIWCYSANAVEWRKSVRRYSLSLAVMSIIGYVIGLGDRHLDNVLIKLATGEILHIDYSVCFEKGKTLRVPEKVPFRMTQNLKDALGLVGTEGAFRLACNHVLKILRKERETLLTLLEAFVYDPLVDWTVSDDGTTTISRRTTAYNAANIIANLDNSSISQRLSPNNLYKNKKYEVDLSRQTMALRITEIKPTWMKYKNDFYSQLNNLEAHLQKLLDYRSNILHLEQERDSYSKQQAMVRELEALGSAQTSHAFIQRYNNYKHELNNFNKIKLMAQKTANDVDLLLSTYFNIIIKPEIVHNIEVDPKISDIEEHNEVEFDIIKDLLIDSNWNNVYVQAKFNRHEMENTFIQTQRSALECRDLLVSYSRIMQFYPRSQLENYRLLKYKRTFSNLMGVAEDTSVANSKESTENVEYCVQYFDSMKLIYLDLQKNTLDAKQILEEHKQQLIPESSFALNAINDFVSINPSYNIQLLNYCMLQHILQASQVFQLHEQALLQNLDSFLPNKQLSFLQLINTFVNTVYNAYNNLIPNNDIIEIVITALQSVCYLRECLQSVISKMFSIFMMDDINSELQEVFNEYEVNKSLNTLEKYLPLNEVFVVINEAVNNLELSLKVLQEKIFYLQEGCETKEMTSWNIDVSTVLHKLSCDLKITLVDNIKSGVESFKTNNVISIFDPRKIHYAIDDLIHGGIQSTLFNSLISFTIKTVHQNISNTLVQFETLNEIDLSNADLLCGHLYVSLQHESLIVCDNFVVMHHSKLLEEYQVITTAYFWLNEQNLKDIPVTQTFLSSKREFLTRFHDVYQVLTVWKSTILKIQADLEMHRRSFNDLLLSLNSAEDLIIKQQQFENAINYANQRYNFFLNLVIKLLEYVSVILQFEMCSKEQSFENLVKLYNDTRQEWLKSERSITSMERNLVELLDPEDKIDQYWIENVSGLLDEMIYGVQKKISDVEKEEKSMENVLLADGQQMQSLLDSTLRLDLRQLLKILTKICKQSTKGENDDLCQDLRDIQQSLKLFQTKLSELQTQLLARDFDYSSITNMQEKIKELCCICQKNNNDLNAIIVRLLQINTEREQQQQKSESASQNDLINKEVANSEICEQKRNAYAVSVWKRIRMKLEGRDPDHNRRCSVAEQVDFVIREATNEENLASLYEGWTPWV